MHATLQRGSASRSRNGRRSPPRANSARSKTAPLLSRHIFEMCDPGAVEGVPKSQQAKHKLGGAPLRGA